METKAIVAIMVTVLLVFSVFYVLPVRAAGVLKIGVIGPVGWPQFAGMQEAAILARDWINGPGGGIVIDGTRYDVSLHFGDEHSVDQRPDLGAFEMIRLITVEEVDFVVGGFRSENVFVMREVAMDYNKLFFICGAATNELVDCGAGTCGACVKCDYARYKYLFRVMPANDTTLLLNLLGFLGGHVLPYKLVPLFGDPVRTAVIAEDLEWTVDMYNALVYGGYLGPQADIVYSARTSKHETDFNPHLDAMHALEVRLIVHLFSTPSGVAFISQWAPHPIKAVPVGINVLSQTGQTSEYETVLAASGTRTPVSEVSEPYTTVEFWDLYLATFGCVPMYTAFGVYDAIIAMHDMLETQRPPTYIRPPFDLADANALVPVIEATDRESILGRFKYTQYHDPFSNEYGAMWTQGYVRPLVVQWQAGKLEVVWPMDQPYSKIWVLPLVLKGVRTWYWAGNTRIMAVAVGNVDGDGSAEIVTGGHARWWAQLCVWEGATPMLEGVRTWEWEGSAEIWSVAVGDVDGDGQIEIVTGGCYWHAAPWPLWEVAQLCVWSGSLDLESVKTWYWMSHTNIYSVAVGDVDGDGSVEIVTGGYYWIGDVKNEAQLCVWNGLSMRLEGVRVWSWEGPYWGHTAIESVAVGDVDGDGNVEIVTGGVTHDGTRYRAQLCVWDGATLSLEGVKTWYWTSGTYIYSVAVGDVDGDGSTEIVTGGRYWDGTRYRAQLCVWDGATLSLEGVKTWYWTDDTDIHSVACGDVDKDGSVEIVTGGFYHDGTRYVAQLCLWDGATLGLEGVRTWYWVGDTIIESVAISDVDGDEATEIVTGGCYDDGTDWWAQLCVWGFT